VKSRVVRIGISVAISAAFLALAVRNVRWSEAIAALEGANYLYIPPLMGMGILTLYTRAQRWRLLLKPIGRPPVRLLFHATNIGFMANMLLPLRAGEVIRPVLASRRAELPLGGVLATILLERIFDMFTVLLLFGLSVMVVPLSEQAMHWGLTLTALAVVVGACIGLLRWQEDLALGVIRRLCDLLPGRIGGPAYGFVAGFVKALEILGSPSDFARAFAWSLYVWLVIAALNALGLAAFHLPVQSALVVTAIIAIAVSVPSAPGYIGSFQLGCVVALAMYAVPESKALAFSIVHHLAQFVTTVGAGLYSLWSENLTLREVESVERGNGTVA
jgi:glycosyltransferase 2 family protein